MSSENKSDAMTVAGDEGKKARPFIGSHLTLNYKEDTSGSSGFRCGSCCAVNTVQLGEISVRCKDCGYRVMYKIRQRRPLVYSAR